MPLRFVARLGAAIASPRLALRNACRDDVAGAPGTDAAVLIALSFLVRDLTVAISAVWTTVGGDVSGGLMMLANSLAHEAIHDVVVLGVAGAVIFAAAGKQRRLGRDFDLGAVAFVPVAFISMAVHLVGQLAELPPEATVAARYLGYAWCAGLVALGISVARSPAQPESASRVARLSGALFLGVAALSIAIGAVAIARHPERVRPVVAGDRAPVFSLPTIDDSGHLAASFDTASTDGKVVVLDFWATWCGPCREAMPVVQDIHDSYSGKGVVVLSINTEGPGVARAARRMADELGVTTRLLSDDGRVSRRYKVTTIPHMVVIGRQGMVQDVHRGFTSKASLRNRLRAVIEELL